MEEKAFFLRSDDLSMDSQGIIQKLQSIPSTIIRCDRVQPPSNQNEFASIEDYVLFIMRTHRLLKNERTLLMSEEDVCSKISLIFARLAKDQGNRDVEVSDVLEVFNKLASSKLQGETNLCFSSKIHEKAFNAYLADQKRSNLIDVWDLLSCLKKHLSSNESLTSLLRKESLLIEKSSLDSIDVHFLRTISPNGLRLIQVETPLDASLNGDHEGEVKVEIVDTAFEDLPVGQNDSHVTSSTERYVGRLIEGYLRLISNSRDELSLAKVLCGPGGALTHEAFTEIKREGAKINMPLYQTLVSFAQKLKLGGKSYAPKDDHPLMPYSKEIAEFIELMDKLHDKIEEEKQRGECVRKVLSVIKLQVLKNYECSMKTSSVEKVFARFLSMAASIMDRQDSVHSETPKKEVGCGGSLVGRKNLKVIRGLVDHLSALPVRPVNVHALMGKIQINQSTPLNVPSVAALFASPEGGAAIVETEDLKIETASLGERLGIREVLAKEKLANKSHGLPKYQSALSWAPESSPVVVAETSFSTVGGPTLQCPARGRGSPVGDDTPVRSVAGKKGEFEIYQDEKDLGKQEDKKRKITKRSILKDIANEQTVPASKKPKKNPKTSEKNSESNKSDSHSLKLREKPKKSKKKLEPIKGQMKMTAFLRM